MPDSLFEAKQHAAEAGASLIDEPIINGPFDEPSSHRATGRSLTSTRPNSKLRTS
jgi:hypothetical protein